MMIMLIIMHSVIHDHSKRLFISTKRAIEPEGVRGGWHPRCSRERLQAVGAVALAEAKPQAKSQPIFIDEDDWPYQLYTVTAAEWKNWNPPA